MTDVDIVPIIGVGAALVIALIVCIYRVDGKLSKIEDNTRGIPDIRNELTKLTERLDMALRIGIQLPKGTTTLTLKNLGKVEVTAEPNDKGTDYRIQVEKPVLKGGLIAKKSKETEMITKERELFSKEPNVIVYPDSKHMVLTVPSTDSTICSRYVSLFLKWLDTTYWEALKEVQEYERITV
jgi:hypothetical protein